MKLSRHVKGRHVCDMAQVTEISAKNMAKISHCIVLINVILGAEKQARTVYNKGKHGLNFQYI